MDDPVGATIVHVARATGQPVLSISRQSYALTIWTGWHLQQLDERLWIERRYDRFDLAGLITIGHHNPADLSPAMDSFTNTVTTSPMSSGKAQNRQERLNKMLKDHLKLVPIEQPIPEA